MKSIKVIIFAVGICLANFVGGIPSDSRNLFITHSIFFSPILLEFYPLLEIKSFFKWIVKFIWFAGIIAMIANILGVIGILTIATVDDAQKVYEVTLNSDYSLGYSFGMGINNFLLCIQLVYATVFLGTLTLSHWIKLDNNIQKGKDAGKGMEKHVHSQ
ncbi:hypothetical protein [Pseudalkalibacillus sp. NRS-1564]|uniref:hypothetical protein n=1 Tax=Pseudalkalibacillus sp. NRS-1564 TaxID=3233900 RepID=UPI003D267DA3